MLNKKEKTSFTQIESVIKKTWNKIHARNHVDIARDEKNWELLKKCKKLQKNTNEYQTKYNYRTVNVNNKTDEKVGLKLFDFVRKLFFTKKNIRGYKLHKYFHLQGTKKSQIFCPFVELNKKNVFLDFVNLSFERMKIIWKTNVTHEKGKKQYILDTK